MNLRAASTLLFSPLRRVRPSAAIPLPLPTQQLLLLSLPTSATPSHHNLSTSARPRGAAARSQQRRRGGGGGGGGGGRSGTQSRVGGNTAEAQHHPASHPPLQQTLRKFYLKVHPDLFTHHPTQKHVNQESFSRFQAFLDEVRDQTTAPPRAGLHAYRFYLKTKEEGKFQEVALELRTTGGDCRNVVQRSLEGFFKECGLPERFTWAEGDWGYSIEVMSEEERKRQEAEY